MDTGTMLKTLQDPMGIPFYPAVFQFLMVLTFTLHILFIHLTIGASFLSVYGFLKSADYWKQISRTMIRTTTASISLAMVFGVAPLLFVQVLYDPLWYTSNMLSAAWAMGFVFIVIIAYSFTYVAYLRNHTHSSRSFAVWGGSALVLFLLAGFIMHVLNYQSLQPEKWINWYIRDGTVDTSGSSLHDFQISRFLHFIVPAFIMTGIFLMLYAWYFKDREDKDKNYLQWAAKTGANLSFYAIMAQVVIGFWWLFNLPWEFEFYINPLLLTGAVLGIVLLFVLSYIRKNPVQYAIPAGIVAFLTIFGMSYARETLRTKYLERFDYSIFKYKMNIDWGSTALFFLTFLIGVIVISYFATLIFKAGRISGTYNSTPAMNSWWKLSITLLVLWIITVVSLGIIITVRNYL